MLCLWARAMSLECDQNDIEQGDVEQSGVEQNGIDQNDTKPNDIRWNGQGAADKGNLREAV